MAKPARPSVTLNPVADAHHAPHERVVEVSFPNTTADVGGGMKAGCLIALRELEDGTAGVSIYRADASIRVRASWGDGRPILSSDTADIARTIPPAVLKAVADACKVALADPDPVLAIGRLVRAVEGATECRAAFVAGASDAPIPFALTEAGAAAARPPLTPTWPAAIDADATEAERDAALTPPRGGRS